ncbi:MAG TPA: RNA polymerase sigma factor [Polyangiaceae bacterium]|nr:RNA polymerase sigma factor [Polyangiaceae bacterium]
MASVSFRFPQQQPAPASTVGERSDVFMSAQPPPAEESGDLGVLAKLAMTREPAHQRRFLEAIVPSLRSICRKSLGEGHPDLEDTLQECLVAVLQALPKFRDESPIIHYVNRIAVRIAIAARRRGHGRDKRLQAFAAELVVDSETPAADLLLLRSVVDELPAAQAEAIVLRMILGYSLEEMAAHMKVPLNTAKSRLRVGKEFLRARLEEAAPAARRPR